jgi:hypothetical protein
MAKSIVIAGSMAQKPRHGGHAWVFLQYLLGFKRLGWEVLFLDRLEPEMCADEAGTPCPVERSPNVDFVRKVMDRFDLRGAFAVLCSRGTRVVGMPRREVIDRTRKAALLLNVMGFLQDEEILACAARRVFLDIDPGFGQMWQELGLHAMFRGHDDYVTIGERIGQPDCLVPTCGLRWVTTPQPVVLDYWPPVADGGACITSVSSWRGAYRPVEYGGITYGLRVHEFRKFVALPRLSGRPFQLALDIHPTESKDLTLLRDNGWSLVDPETVARNPAAYQAYIRASKAEFMVAKGMYVQTRSGWFSDRSTCYLASGKPVLAQDTGVRDLYPTGKGLLIFTSLEEAVARTEELAADYRQHARAARALAEEYFDSDKVLPALLCKLGIHSV